MKDRSAMNSQKTTGDILIERPIDVHRQQPAANPATSTAPAYGLGNSASATLHMWHWSELAKKSCINHPAGNGCWSRHCACEDCQTPWRVRRDSSSSGGGCESGCSLCDAWEPVVVIDEQLNISYEVLGLRQNELPVKGTYIDPRIIPGFKYNIRYLDGPVRQQQPLPHSHRQKLVYPEPVRLLGIGAGYGKRLSFDTKRLNGKPADHFWSDSCPDGYALSLAPLDVGQKFIIYAQRGDQELGRATVTWVAPEPAECRVKLSSDSVTVKVAAAFKANVSLTACRCLLGCHDYEDVPLTGLTRLSRSAGSRSVAKVMEVEGVRLPEMSELRLVPTAN